MCLFQVDINSAMAIERMCYARVCIFFNLKQSDLSYSCVFMNRIVYKRL